MRPTLLMFRSPKERTPGYHEIKVRVMKILTYFIIRLKTMELI